MSKTKDLYTDAHIKYYSLIYSAVYTKIENINDVEDICQEIFIRLFEKFEEVRDIRKWLYGTMKNVVLEYFRKSKGDVSINDVFDDIGLTFVNGLKEARMIIAEAIEDMSNFGDEYDKAIFDMIAIYNYSYGATAAEMGFSKSKVQYRYELVTKRILDYLKNKGIKNLEELL